MSLIQKHFSIFLPLHLIQPKSVALCLMFWLPVCLLIKLEYWCSCFTSGSELGKSRGKLKIQTGVLAKHVRERSLLKVSKISFLLLVCGRSPLDCGVLRECPNQQHFYFDSEEWGYFQRGSDKSSVLAGLLVVVVVVLVFFFFSFLSCPCFPSTKHKLQT